MESNLESILQSLTSTTHYGTVHSQASQAYQVLIANYTNSTVRLVLQLVNRELSPEEVNTIRRWAEEGIRTSLADI